MVNALLNGIVVGAIPALLAVGIVLIYKGSRTFNFAQAEFGTISAYAAYLFITVWDLPYAVGAVAAVGVGALSGFLLERLVVRPLFNAARVTLLVATAGVALLVTSLEFNLIGTGSKVLAPAIGGLGPEILGVFVSFQNLLIFTVLIGLAAVLAWFFRQTTLGLAILASSEDSFGAELSGVGSKRVSTIVWTLAGALGGLAGVLFAGTNTALLPGFMTVNFLLPAFVAAVIGGLTSIPGAFLGGEITAIGGSLAEFANRQYLDGAIPGPGNVVMIVLIVAILAARPQGLLGKAEAVRA